MNYEELVLKLKPLGPKVCELLSDLLKLETVQFHSIDYRIKTEESAEKKLLSKPDRYSDLSDLRDLLGVRVITYFSDDVDKVSDIVEREFSVDYDQSVDKRALLRENAFGYTSLHYVVSMHERRTALLEYQRYEGVQFELQIRSILQHAWAEIEHDLGYKSTNSLPKEVRRRFTQLSGLLELADDDFVRVRDKLREYEEEIARLGKEGLKERELNLTTLKSFVGHDVIETLDKYLATTANHDGDFEADSTVKLDERVNQFHVLGIRTIDQAQEAIERNMKDIAAFAYLWIRELYLPEEKRFTYLPEQDRLAPSVAIGRTTVSRGSSLVYALGVIALKEHPKDAVAVIKSGWRYSDPHEAEQRHREMKKAWAVLKDGFEPPDWPPPK